MEKLRHRWHLTPPVIVGEDPFKDLGELIREGERLAEQERGNGGGVQFKPADQSSHPALRASSFASVDGVSQCGSYLVEIKYVESVYRKTVKFGRP